MSFIGVSGCSIGFDVDEKVYEIVGSFIGDNDGNKDVSCMFVGKVDFGCDGVCGVGILVGGLEGFFEGFAKGSIVGLFDDLPIGRIVVGRRVGFLLGEVAKSIRLSSILHLTTSSEASSHGVPPGDFG